MADVRTATNQTEEVRVARNAEGREMSALSYTAVYRQRLKEEQIKKISQSKLRVEDDAIALEKAKQKEARRNAMEEQLRRERDAIAARNAGADAVLQGVSAAKKLEPAAQPVAEQPAPAPQAAPVVTSAPAPKVEPAPAPKAQSASVQQKAPIVIPSPVVRRMGSEQAPKAAPTPAPQPTLRRPSYTPTYVPAYKAPVSGTVTIGGAEMHMVADPYDSMSFTAYPAEPIDDDIVIVTGDETEPVTLKRADDDILYFDENGDLIQAADETALEEQTPDEQADAPTPFAEEAPIGEPPMPVEEPTPERHIAKKVKRVERRAEKQRAKEHPVKFDLKEYKRSQEEEEARLAEEAVRAALAEDAEKREAKAAREAAIVRLARSNAAEKEALQERQAVVDEQTRLAEEEQAAAAAQAQTKLTEERQAYDARVQQLQQAMEAEELALAEEELARTKEHLDAEAQRNARAAAERASERDRAAAERAEDEALRSRDIKDWRNVRTEGAPAEEALAEEDVSQEDTDAILNAVAGPSRVDPRRPSYTRSERRALEEQAKQRTAEAIADELALWNEEELAEDAFAVLPEGFDEMSRRDKRRAFKDETAGFKQLDRMCTKTYKLLRRSKQTNWITVRAGMEALVAEKAFIESLARAVKMARPAKRRGHIRSLCQRLASELAREGKLLRRMKDLAGFAPQASDPMMPKALRKQKPFKTPTKLYRKQQESESQLS